MDTQDKQDHEQPRADEERMEQPAAAAEPPAEGCVSLFGTSNTFLTCDDPECVVAEDGYFNLPLAE